MNANDILFRCSGLGYLTTTGITEKQSETIASLSAKEKLTDIQRENLRALLYKRDNPEISDGCKTHLIDLFVSAQYGRKEEIKNKFLDKGNEREEDSVTLLSLAKKIFFKKNERELRNGKIKGTPDLFIGKSIYEADETIDTKTSWSAHTFFRAKNKELDPMYYFQGLGYMILTGAKLHTVAYCLVNGTHQAIMNEKRIAGYSYGADPSTNPEYIKACQQIEINHIFDLKNFQKENPGFDFDSDLDKWTYDIPASERLFTIAFERNEVDILKLYKRIEMCRKWMDENLFKEVPKLVVAL